MRVNLFSRSVVLGCVCFVGCVFVRFDEMDIKLKAVLLKVKQLQKNVKLRASL